MGGKGNLLIIFVFFLFLISFVSSAGNYAIKTDVEYDRELLGQFLTNKWVHVTVDIRDSTNITIPNRNSPDFASKLNEKNSIMINLTDAVLTTLSEDEFQLKTKSEFGGFFSGNITREGFDKLLKDERVDHIYSKKEITTQSFASAKNFFTIFLPLLLLVVLIILIVKLKNKKWKLKK